MKFGGTKMRSKFDGYVTDHCRLSRTPEDSYQRIIEHLHQLLPKATDKQISKMIG